MRMKDLRPLRPPRTKCVFRLPKIISTMYPRRIGICYNLSIDICSPHGQLLTDKCTDHSDLVALSAPTLTIPACCYLLATNLLSYTLTRSFNSCFVDLSSHRLPSSPLLTGFLYNTAPSFVLYFRRFSGVEHLLSIVNVPIRGDLNAGFFHMLYALCALVLLTVLICSHPVFDPCVIAYLHIRRPALC